MFLWNYRSSEETASFLALVESMKEFIIEKSDKDLLDWLASKNEPDYRLGQINSWIYEKLVENFHDMTDLSSSLRDKLEQSFILHDASVEKTLNSTDGASKFLVRLSDHHLIETVLIRQENHFTVCVSSQVGCALRCKFCATGSMGITRNLRVSEILSQILLASRFVPTGVRINVVFMGMGEPLLNSQNLVQSIEILTSEARMKWSPLRITVSTAGIVPEIVRLGKQNLGVKLAVSLNAPDDATRSKLMPINRKYSIKQLVNAIRDFPSDSGHHRITYEYILIKGINDSEEAAKRLIKLLDRRRSKINLIPFNRNPGSKWNPPDESAIGAFQKILISHGFLVRIRKSQGSEILAACGQLAGLA